MNHLLVENLNVSFQNKSFLKAENTIYRNIQFPFKNKHITVQKVQINKEDNIIRFIGLYIDEKLLNIEIDYDIKPYLSDLLDFLTEEVNLYGLTFILDRQI